MRSVLTISALLASLGAADAQPWMPQQNQAPVLLVKGRPGWHSSFSFNQLGNSGPFGGKAPGYGLGRGQCEKGRCGKSR